MLFHITNAKRHFPDTHHNTTIISFLIKELGLTDTNKFHENLSTALNFLNNQSKTNDPTDTKTIMSLAELLTMA